MMAAVLEFPFALSVLRRKKNDDELLWNMSGRGSSDLDEVWSCPWMAIV
jgi:hypothetical protein